MSSPAWGAGDQTLVAARRWKAVTLANRGLTHKQIALEMLPEYRETTNHPDMTIFQAESHVGVDIHRALKEYRQRSDHAVEERITAQSLRFAEIRRRLYSIIAQRHPVLYQGTPVHDEEGRPLQDAGPVLAALAQLQQLEDRQARLEGTYQREKLDIALERRVEDEAVDVVEAILAGFGALPDLEPALRQRALEAAGAHLRTIQGEVVPTNESPDQ